MRDLDWRRAGKADAAILSRVCGPLRSCGRMGGATPDEVAQEEQGIDLTDRPADFAWADAVQVCGQVAGLVGGKAPVAQVAEDRRGLP